MRFVLILHTIPRKIGIFFDKEMMYQLGEKGGYLWFYRMLGDRHKYVALKKIG